MDENAPELLVVRTVEECLNEADRLIAEGHPEMAVVRAVSAFETFMKRAFIEPYLRRVVLADNTELGAIMSDALLGPQGWRSRLPGVLRSCWQIEVSRMAAWSTMNDAWRVRNKIVHDGGTCERAEAASYIRTIETLMKALLKARAAGAPGVSLEPVAP
jgi:hypothetical protein